VISNVTGRPGLHLADRRSFDRIAVRCHVLDLQGDGVAGAKLAVDGQIRHGQVADLFGQLQPRADGPDLSRLQGWLLPDDLSLVQRHVFAMCSLNVLVLRFRKEMHDPSLGLDVARKNSMTLFGQIRLNRRVDHHIRNDIHLETFKPQKGYPDWCFGND